MGFPGKAPVRSAQPSLAQRALGSFGVTSSGKVVRRSPHRRRHKGGYRMPAIVKKQIEAQMRFQDQIIVALIAGAVHK